MASGHKNNNNNKNRGGDQIMFNKIKTIEVWSHENQGWDVLSELAPHEYMVLLLDSQNMRLFPANAKWGSVDDVPPMLAWDRPHILGFHLWNSNMELNTNNNQPAASISFRLREAGVLSQVGETSNGGAITHIAQTIQEGLPDDKCLFLRFQFYSQIFKVWIPMLKKQNINYLNKFDPDTDRPAQKFKAPPAAISLSSSTSSSGVLNPALWFKDSMKSSFEFWDENKRRWMAPRMLDVEDFRFTMRNGMVYYYVAAYSENLRQPALSRENNDAVQSQVISWPIGDVIGFGNDENSPGPGSLTYAIAMKIKSPGTYSSFGDPSEDMLQQHRSRYNKNCQTSQKIHDLIRDELASSLDDPHATLWVRFQSSKPFPKASPFLKEDAQMTFMGSVTDTLPQKFPCNPQGHYNMNKRQESIASSRDNQMNNENGSWRSPEKATFNSNNNHNNSKHSKNNRSPGGDKGWGNDFGGGKQKEKGTVAENVDWAAAAMADTKPLDEFWTKDGSDEQKVSNNAGGDDDGWAVPPSVELLDWDTPAVPANNDWDSPAGQQVTDNEWGIGDTKSSAAATGGAEKAAAASGWDDQIQDAPGQTDLLTGQPPPTAPKSMQNNNNNNNNNNKGGWGNSNHVEKKSDHFDAKRTRKPRERPGDNNSNHNNSYGQYQQGGHHHNHNNHHDNHNNMRPPPSPAGKHNKHMKDNGPNRSRNNHNNINNNNSNNDNFSRGDITDRSDLISIISSVNHRRMSSMGSDAGGGYEPSNNDWDNHHHQHNQYHKNNYDHDHNSTSNGTVGGGGGGSGSVSSGPYDSKNKFQGSGGGYLAALDGFVIGAQQQQHDQDSSEDTSRDRFFRRDYTKQQVKNLHDRRKTLLENLKDVDEQIKLLQQKMDYQDELWKVSLELNKRKRNGER